MAYTSQAALLGKIPLALLTQGLDDDGDGQADPGKLDAMVGVAENEINGILAGRYNVPFAEPVPPLVGHAALIFVLESLYEGRGWTDESQKNPWSYKARQLRLQLKEIGAGDAPLSKPVDAQAPQVSVISESSALGGSLLF